MDQVTGIYVVTPMTVGVGEEIPLKVKVRGEKRHIPNLSAYCTKTPRLKTGSNIAPRGLLFEDDALAGWAGQLTVEAEGALDGPQVLEFDGENQGVFPGDDRAIRIFTGFRWTKPGVYNVRLTDPESGTTALSNPVVVSENPPAERIYFGDIHWQTYLTDGLRLPEELYFFARDEGFLDFGAITDHVEGITDRQWEYMVGVTNDFNLPGEFSTLVGQEWTSFAPSGCGHRNLYYRGDAAPVLRSDDPRYDTLEKLWAALEGTDVLCIPHHSANIMMGVNWDCGWNRELEPAVEITSVWGSSEIEEEKGNVMPIRVEGGVKAGQYVYDALKRGYRFGFVGGGDIHDGRPGDCFRGGLWRTPDGKIERRDTYQSGFTAVRLPENTREGIYDAIAARGTYATTQKRFYMEFTVDGNEMGSEIAQRGSHSVHIFCATDEPIESCTLVGPDGEVAKFFTDENRLRLRADANLPFKAGFYYPRLVTQNGNMAWASPVWIL